MEMAAKAATGRKCYSIVPYHTIALKFYGKWDGGEGLSGVLYTEAGGFALLSIGTGL